MKTACGAGLAACGRFLSDIGEAVGAVAGDAAPSHGGAAVIALDTGETA